MNSSNLKEWKTPRGNVVELAIDGKIAWKKVVGVPISTRAVGSSVFMKVFGTRTEFIVVHQGRPSTAYDSSCNGTWLLMKHLYTYNEFDDSSCDYRLSNVHNYLKNTLLKRFDSNIQSVIKEVKIPYTKVVNGVASETVATGANGFSTKLFLLSSTEVSLGTDSWYLNKEGAVLSYFKNANDAGRKATYKNETVGRSWWLRTPHCGYSDTAELVDSWGGFFSDLIQNEKSVRPALILPSDALVDGNFNVLA